MDQLECVMEVQRRADNLLKNTVTNEHDVYSHAINDFMNEQRQYMPTDKADHLHAFLLHNFGIE
ncbi:hypothetical protein HUG15_06145 [Salicibibacter cibarius]|uniref:Uncharacterized protein n=1 Tax=Salicibibacter cibarius TaxID=2743000 RepID=A0A7T6Z1F3_9BACI|nr:hypothetical protein [Salicibibacter cibarius]QQK75223.1 hypothetical protein HUG15_06145 [Salicibibacter cibarius]